MATMRPGGSLEGVHALLREGTVAGLSDRDLLDRFERGADDAAGRAFAALVDRHGPMVLRTCRAVLPDPADAQDAFQVTFLVLARKAGTIRDRGSVAAWLHGVAYRTAAYARGASARRRRHERAAAARTREAVDPSRPDEGAAAVVEEVGRLPERLRGAVVLCEFEGLSVDEAARRLGCPAGTVKSRLSRARDRLKRRLTHRGLAPTLALPPAPAVPPSLATATVAAASSRTVPLTAALAAWESEVLRAMSLTKLKAAALVLILGLAAGGTALVAAGQAPKKPDADQPEPKAETVDGDPTIDDVLDVLARSQLDGLERRMKELNLAWLKEVPGDRSPQQLREYLQAARDYRNAHLAFTSTSEQRIKFLRRHLDGMTQEFEGIRKLFAMGHASKEDVRAAETELDGFSLLLLEEESGRKASLKEPNSRRPFDPAEKDAILNRYYQGRSAAKIKAALAREISIDLPATTTLGDALKQFKAATATKTDPGVPVYVDPNELHDADLRIDRQIGPLKAKGTAAQVLTKLLDPVGLKFEAADGLVKITAK